MKIEIIESAEQRPPRKANDCIVDPRHFVRSRPLFDEFWREGELALLFGPSGAGKSLLAVQIADALARGRQLDGFKMPTGRPKVLYVDLASSDRQFQERYCYYSPDGNRKSYRFAENLYRDRPAPSTDLCEWLAAAVRESGFRVVIIDDLTSIRRTSDGVREMLAVMHRLRELREELGISILVVAASDEPGTNRAISERDLRRSRVLCNLADSVFAIAHGRNDGERCLFQTRSRSGNLFWQEHNGPRGSVVQLENGLTGFKFDDRFSPDFDADTIAMICNIHDRREKGVTYRAIAAELEISKTSAVRLNKKWLPVWADMDDDDDDFYDEDDDDPDEWNDDSATEDFEPDEPIEPPSLHGPERVSVYDFERGIDGTGNEIFIQTDDQTTRKPIVWYKFDNRGRKIRHERGTVGVNVHHLNAGPYL